MSQLDLLPHALDLSVLASYTGRRYVRVVYGLIDPRRPGEIAYVGRTLGHVIARYFEHIGDGYRRSHTSPRVRWLAELLGLGTPPGLFLIESCWSKHSGAAARERLAEREGFWMVDYKRRGEAWVNQNCDIPWQFKKLTEPSRAS